MRQHCILHSLRRCVPHCSPFPSSANQRCLLHLSVDALQLETPNSQLRLHRHPPDHETKEARYGGLAPLLEPQQAICTGWKRGRNTDRRAKEIRSGSNGDGEVYSRTASCYALGGSTGSDRVHSDSSAAASRAVAEAMSPQANCNSELPCDASSTPRRLLCCRHPSAARLSSESQRRRASQRFNRVASCKRQRPAAIATPSEGPLTPVSRTSTRARFVPSNSLLCPCIQPTLQAPCPPPQPAQAAASRSLRAHLPRLLPLHRRPAK